MKTLKIVLMVYRLTGGGAERVAALWAKGFFERGYKVTLIVLEPTKTKYITPKGIDIKYIGFPVNNKYIRKVCQLVGLVKYHYSKKLYKILHDIKPSVFISVNGPYARDAFNLARDIKTKIIQTYHSSFDLPEDAPEIRKKNAKRVYSLDSKIETRTVLTQADKDYIGNRMKQVFVMPNPLAFDPLREVPLKDKIILACGRLDVWDVKGFDILIKAWGMIADKHPCWKLQIAGGGTKKSENLLKSLAEKCNVNSNVEFLGFKEDIISLYKKSEIFVLSSRYEGFGMVLIEAMSQGCACIACDYKGRQKEIIENDSQGLLCPVNDVNSLADAIDKMISDENYRKQCQTKALSRSSDFSLEVTIDRWERIFNEIGV